MRIALATYERAPLLAPDDQRLVRPLQALGFDVEPVVWSDEGAAWESFDVVVVRSCWDYHRRVAEFFGWLNRLERGGVRVFNSLPLVRWNSNKRYLLDLAQRGAMTIPTRLVPRGDADAVEKIIAEEGWRRFVIKPSTSASGYETHALGAPVDATGRAVIARVMALGDALVQPFADEVPLDGEFSFTFIDGSFSHATLKRASAGEFRVQAEHGGSADSIEAPPALVGQAASVLALLPEVPLYARIDGIQRAGDFLLMELELIEPHLFFDHQPGSADAFAAALARRLAI
jgi:glutathione synthase/RimK-type ligase-like ATP-grasp enzyme